MFDTNAVIDLFGVKKSQKLLIGAYGGNSSIVVFDYDSGSRSPVFRLPISKGISSWMISKLQEIRDAGPGKRFSIMYSDWNKAQKKFINKRTLVIGKDDSKVIFIGVQGEAITDGAKFYFKPFGIETSPDNLDDESKSKLMCNDVISELKYGLPIATALSKDQQTMDAIKEKRKKQYNNNPNSNSNSSAGSPDDDIPF